MIGLIFAAALAAPQSHPAPPPPRPAPVSHTAPITRPVPVARPVVRSAPPPQTRGFSLPHDLHPIQRTPTHFPHMQARPPARGPVVQNPHHWSNPWQWNGGVAWIAAPIYWGGGFWGAYELGLDESAYVVEPDTPGAQLLAEYNLTQTPCGGQNLVEIYGPDGSEICAFPNALVSAGQYSVDPTTLTLVSYQ